MLYNTTNFLQGNSTKRQKLAEKQPNGAVVSLQLLLLQYQMSSFKMSIVIFNLSEGIFDSGDIYIIYFTSTIKVASLRLF